jgi:hypothetical protein
MSKKETLAISLVGIITATTVFLLLDDSLALIPLHLTVAFHAIVFSILLLMIIYIYRHRNDF